MKQAILFFATLLAFATQTTAQTTCNAAGNMILYSNYDGGKLVINVDVNIPNLIIGVVSYEADSIIITGAFASNVTTVRYAGYNSSTTCSQQSFPTTVITGAPTTATTSIVLMPTSPVTNTNGYGTIICGYSCSITTNQGGCNTADQIAGYFQQQFPSASIRYHKIQYNCWTGTQLVSAAGNCCAGVTTGPPPSTLAINATATNITCNGQCTSTATASVTGGVTPYSYQWTGGPATASWTNRCAGTYYVSVTDAANTVRVDTVVITQPAPISTTIAQTACSTYFFNGANITTPGQYRDTFASATGCDSVIIFNLTFTPVNINVNQTGATLTATAPAPATYQWLRCTGTTTVSYTVVAGATAQSYTATQSGQYAVRVTQSGCADTSTCRTVTISSSVEDAANTAVGVRAYPNPISGDHFTIETPKAFTGATFTLTDATGRVVKEGTLSSAKTDVRVSGLAAGAYLLRIAGMEGAVQLVR